MIIAGRNALWIAGTVGTFCCAILTLVQIVREVLPYLKEEDQNALRASLGGFGFNNRFGRALSGAWKEHGHRFPGSRKRIAFAGLLIVTVLAVITYALLG